MNKQKEAYPTWLFFYILLPLAPVFVKAVIVFFGDRQSVILNILDSSELLYYSFIICVITLYDLCIKEGKTPLELLFALFAFLISVINTALLVMVYLSMHSPLRIQLYSFFIAILVAVFSSLNKWREVVRS